MMQITAANSAICQRAPSAPNKVFATKTAAKLDAVATFGEHAREGFEFLADKCDGGWRWTATDEVRPDTDQQVKANGGKKGSKMPKLPIPPHPQPPAEAGGASNDFGGTQDPPAPKLAPASLLASVATADDGLGISAILKRPGKETNADRDARLARHKKLIGPDRAIKNPPSVKAAKAKGAKSAGKQTKTALIATLLMNPKGCTTADILKATGWPSVSVPQQAKAVGLKLRKEKDGKVTRYFGVPK
jgi:hypothetical protein